MELGSYTNSLYLGIVTKVRNFAKLGNTDNARKCKGNDPK